MLHCLHGLPSPLHRPQPCSQAVHRLVVGTVDGKVLAIEPPYGAVCHRAHLMKPVPLLVGIVPLYVLVQGTAQGHVCYLHPPADAKDRPPCCQEITDQLQLQDIPGLINIPAVEDRGAVVPGVQIPTAWEQKPVAGGKGIAGIAHIGPRRGQSALIVGELAGDDRQENLMKQSGNLPGESFLAIIYANPLRKVPPLWYDKKTVSAYVRSEICGGMEAAIMKLT